MASQNSASTPRLTPPTEVPNRTLPPLLQLVHSSDSLAHKPTPKSPRKTKASPTRTEWHEREEHNLPSVSSF
jgi:hypothetical protein